MFKNKNISRFMGVVLVLVICASLMASCQDVASPTSSLNKETTSAAVDTIAVDATTVETAVLTSTTAIQSTTVTKAAQEKLTEKKTTAKAQNKVPAKTTDKKTSVKVPSPTAKVYNAATAKKPATTTKKKVVTTTAKKTEARNYSLNAGLTDAEVLWAQQKANEYIKTLKGVTLDPTADGYTLSCGIPDSCDTKEKLLKRFKDDINCDYEFSIESDWHQIGMYLKLEKTSYGSYIYTVMNICNG